MKREEFLNQLEYLLQDVSEEEKRDAIDYYRDYLEEAGPEKEHEVLSGFGSPERIAAIIRTDLLGGMDAAGEFTDKGYEDVRFETSSYPAVRKQEVVEHKGFSSDGSSDKGNAPGRENSDGADYKNGSYAAKAVKERGTKPVKDQGWFRFIMIAIFIIVCVPILFSAAVAVFSGAIGIGSVLLALLIVLAVLTLVGFVAGAALIFFGITSLILDGWFGIMCIGAGLAFLGIGFVLLVCSVLFYGTFLPWLVRAAADVFSRIFGRGNKKKDEKKDHSA